MLNLIELQQHAREIFSSMLHSVDASEATRRAVNLDGSRLRVRDTELDSTSRPIYVVSIGKAALPMVLGVHDQL